MSEGKWMRMKDENVDLVYRGEGNKVFVKMWFEGNGRKFVYEGVIGFKEIDDEIMVNGVLMKNGKDGLVEVEVVRRDV